MIAGKKELLASALECLRPLGWLHRARWHGLVVFNYHRIGSSHQSPWDHALWSADTDAFAEQVRFLKSNFDLAGPADLDTLFTRRSGRAVMLTFDDGYRDNYELAFPVLQAERATATFFITSGFLDEQRLPWWDEIAWMLHSCRRDRFDGTPWNLGELALEPSRETVIQAVLRKYKQLNGSQAEEFISWLGTATGTGRCPSELAREFWMTWDMVRSMHRSGMSIGGHTVTHPVLAACSREQQRFEIEVSKQRIEHELQASISAFSYPVGQPHCFDDVTKHLVEQAGYRYAFSFFGGFARFGRFDRLALPRVAVSPWIRPALFRSMATHPQLFLR